MIKARASLDEDLQYALDHPALGDFQSVEEVSNDPFK